MVVEEVGGDNRRCNAGSVIIVAQLPIAAFVDARVDALLCVVNYFFMARRLNGSLHKNALGRENLSNTT